MSKIIFARGVPDEAIRIASQVVMTPFETWLGTNGHMRDKFAWLVCHVGWQGSKPVGVFTRLIAPDPAAPELFTEVTVFDDYAELVARIREVLGEGAFQDREHTLD